MRRVCLIILVVGLCHDVSWATECVSRGRFPNNDEVDCRGYTMCLPMGGAFMQYKLTCPLGSIYSHSEQQCTTATTYTCLSNYTCNVTGNFENPEADNCTSFVACAMGLVDLVTARRVECPLNQVFNPSIGCVNETEFNCNPVIETTTILTEVTETTVITENANGGNGFSREVPLNSVDVVGANVVIVIMLVFCLIKSV